MSLTSRCTTLATLDRTGPRQPPIWPRFEGVSSRHDHPWSGSWRVRPGRATGSDPAAGHAEVLTEARCLLRPDCGTKCLRAIDQRQSSPTTRSRRSRRPFRRWLWRLEARTGKGGAVTGQPVGLRRRSAGRPSRRSRRCVRARLRCPDVHRSQPWRRSPASGRTPSPATSFHVSLDSAQWTLTVALLSGAVATGPRRSGLARTGGRPRSSSRQRAHRAVRSCWPEKAAQGVRLRLRRL